MEAKPNFRELKELVNDLTKNNCIAFGTFLNNYFPDAQKKDCWVSLNDTSLYTTEELFKIFSER